MLSHTNVSIDNVCIMLVTKDGYYACYHPLPSSAPKVHSNPFEIYVIYSYTFDERYTTKGSHKYLVSVFGDLRISLLRPI